MGRRRRERAVNRFMLDRNPAVAARMHCDKHVVKMCVEEAQMLSTVHRLHGYTGDELYRATHAHHPCTAWAGASTWNYLWSYRLLVNLLAEYTHRYGRTHATARLLEPLERPPVGVPVGFITEVPQAMPEHLRGGDPVEAYRRFYRAEKAHFARWTARPVPAWFSEKLTTPTEVG